MKYELIEYEGSRFFVVDLNRIQERINVFDFLDKIGYSTSKLYDSIDSLFIPPLEYPDIEQTLINKRIVFITGSQEYGKTYTAAKLMWQYYCRGYEPRWVKGSEEYDRRVGRERLEGIRIELKPKHIIYFEDPFGKTRYEKRESLEREIGIILDFVSQVNDAYVIITSREEVFKEFEKEKISAREIQDFEQKLNIRKPSYDYEKRKAILVQWAHKVNCQWLSNQALKDLILNSLRDEMQLPTPLSIRDFALSTVNMQKDYDLIEKMEEKSLESEKAFAREIDVMSEDKIIFLFFPYIGPIPIGVVERVYQEFIKKLQLKDAWDFARVIDWFKDDKVQIKIGYNLEEIIEFSHPTYYQAVEQLLSDDSAYITEPKRRRFAELLVSLVKEEDAISEVGWATLQNFYALTPEVRNQLLAKLAETNEAAESVALTIADNFSDLPVHIRALLYTLAERDKCARRVAYVLEDTFDELPENVRNELVVKLVEKDEAIESVAWIIAGNFDKLPGYVSDLLFRLAEKESVSDDVAWALADNINKFPTNVRNDILVRIAAADKAGWKNISNFMKKNINMLPEEVRNILLLNS